MKRNGISRIFYTTNEQTVISQSISTLKNKHVSMYRRRKNEISRNLFG